MNVKDFAKYNSNTAVEPLVAGTYSVVCAGVIDIGTQNNIWEGIEKLQNQIVLLFEFPSETIEVQGVHMPRMLSMKMTKSMHEMSKMRKTFAAWRGRDFTPQEMQDFELSKLLNVCATAIVKQEVKKSGKTVASISSLGKAVKGFKVDCNKSIYFDLNDKSTYSAIADIPAWVVNMINDSKEAKQRNLFFTKEQQEAKQSNSTAGNSEPAFDGSDDCPF